MSVQPGDTLSLHFALRVRGGGEIDSSFDDAPISLTLGDGTLIASLEQWLIGLAPDERHVFLLEPAQAFGARDPALIQILPLSDFSTAPQRNSVIEFSLPNGTTLAGHVMEVTDSHARVDFNHLLAGLPIEFEVEIVKIHCQPEN
ncbi:peptidylprolyl isomerase [Sulfuriferula sp.]|uniref:FKBP-type peptidyl-prolyl cis-trans isomerase n=1 Tax=Sulfuriferula sp. TaxID=2025307 RepID=UPI0027315343|nr:FKBP-type peptidyl-prolyl cis-trans isomerase [Sulfuriferula sp.]MDP2026137.1 FKBP-type peptidyl-prolyl cis-trans isomerase [Sulfuriferula sp.]